MAGEGQFDPLDRAAEIEAAARNVVEKQDAFLAAPEGAAFEAQGERASVTTIDLSDPLERDSVCHNLTAYFQSLKAMRHAGPERVLDRTYEIGGAMTRDEHLAWCKQRALEYVAAGDTAQALASMTSDLGKHEETRSSVEICALGMFEDTPAKMRRFIEGFN